MSDEISEKEEKIVDRVGSYEFGPKILSKLIGKSTSTLRRWREKGIYIEFEKRGDAKNSPIVYTAKSTAKYLIRKKKKVINYD